MLTVKTITNVVSHNLQLSNSAYSPSDILNGNTEGGYFYIKKSTSSGSSKGSIFFNLTSNGLDLIPSNAIINNFSITFNTEKTNSFGIYDNLFFKINGTTLASIDATIHSSNKIQTTTFQTAKLFEEDIFKSTLEKYIFEIQLSTEGANEFRLHSISFSITYTEMIATSICKLKTKQGLVTIPLYNPISLPRYSMRIMTNNGVKSFDLIDVDDISASPIRVLTPYGIKAVRMSIENPLINIFNPENEKLENYFYDESSGELANKENGGSIVADIACIEYIPVESQQVYDLYCASTTLNVSFTVVEYDESQQMIQTYKGHPLRIPFSEKSKFIRLSLSVLDETFESNKLTEAYNSIVVAKA